MTLHALITRPHPDAEKTATALCSFGIACLLEPMLMIEQHPDAAKIWHKATATPIQAALITSANAIRILSTRTDRRDIPLLTVGDKSAEAARQVGFTNITSAKGNVDDLARLVQKKCSPNRGTLLYLSGEKTAGNLQEKLEMEGFAVAHIIVYDAKVAAHLSDSLKTALSQKILDIALFYSPRTAEHFTNLVNEAGMSQHLASLEAFCLSDNVAKALDEKVWKRINVAESPNNKSLLELIENFQLTMRRNDTIDA